MSEMHFGQQGKGSQEKIRRAQSLVEIRAAREENSGNENENMKQCEKENERAPPVQTRRLSPRNRKKKRVIPEGEGEEDYEISRSELSEESVIQKRSYNFIDPDVKDKLIEFLSTGKYTIKEAAAKFGINYSTAKYLFKKYRAELVEEDEDQHRPLHSLWFSSIAPEPATVEEIMAKVAKVGTLAGQMSVEAEPPKDQLVSLLKETRKLLDLTLIRIRSFPSDKQQPLIEQIMSAHKLLDWHFLAMGGSKVQAQQIDDSIIQHLKALLILAHGLVQKKLKPESIQPKPL